jgi:4-amino-4-deoxy-L-arabinose transferase-like glycosyltransferase
VTLTILAAYRAWEEPTPGRMAVLGIAVGVSALTRSEVVLLAPLIVVPLLWWSRARARHNPLLNGGVAALCIILVIGPWVGYNLARFDRPVTLAGTPEVALAESNCDDVYYGDRVGYWSWSCLTAPLKGAPNNDAAQAKLLSQAGTDYIKTHLDRLPAVVLARIGRTWGFFDPIGQVRLDERVDTHEPFVAVFGALSYYLLAIAAIGGILVLRARRIPVFPLVALAINVTITVMLAFGQTRYRVTAEPAIVLLAAAALDHAWVARATRARPVVRERPTEPVAVGSR